MTRLRKSIQGQWSSRWAFMLAAAGSAVGLGNIWKFPYITGENGGGAFVLVYLICIAILGLPIMMSEIIIGRRGHENPMTAMRDVALESNRSRHWRLVGALGILSGFIVLSYYCVIAGWTIDYIFQAAEGDFAYASAEQVSAIFGGLISNPWRLILLQSLMIGAVMLVIGAGVRKGIERTVYIMFPAMVIILLGLVIYNISSSNFGEAVRFMFVPDFSKLTINGVLVALGHAFFSLTLGLGAMMAYGAYVPKKVSISRATLFIVIADTIMALLAGLAIFPIVFAHGLAPESGPSLIFKTVPIAFGQIQFGSFFAVLFFIMLLMAAFTSAISLLEPVVAWAVEKLKLQRGKATLLIGCFVWVMGLGTIFSFNIWSDVTLFGRTVFENLDYLTANFTMPIGGLLTAVFVAWLMKKAHVKAELDTHARWWFHTWYYTLKFITPLAIIIVFVDLVFGL